jgi:RimJ/RimL family protein N-acetyltransferase
MRSLSHRLAAVHPNIGLTTPMADLTLPDPPLSDGVITLRGFESSDVATLVEICQDPEIPRWTLVPDHYSEQDAHDYLARVAAGLADGTRASFVIVDAGDGRMLGTGGLMAIDHAVGCGEIGYMLAAPARGRGAATRAVHLLVQWAFEALGLERVELHIDSHNAPSLAVAARAGFHQVAEPVMQRAETAHFTDDIFFARTLGG